MGAQKGARKGGRGWRDNEKDRGDERKCIINLLVIAFLLSSSLTSISLPHPPSVSLLSISFRSYIRIMMEHVSER